MEDALEKLAIVWSMIEMEYVVHVLQVMFNGQENVGLGAVPIPMTQDIVQLVPLIMSIIMDSVFLVADNLAYSMLVGSVLSASMGSICLHQVSAKDKLIDV